jgi:cell wall-associated NlpC family hydrolase
MDCSGVISYLLKSFLPDLKLRQANEIYQWAWEKGKFYAVNSRHFNSFEFEKLQPGDLLFWSGTYKISREPPVTHVMLYLGKNKKGKRLMFGASNGRNYNGNKRGGVSVFDFQLPASHSPGRFLGYSCIPFLTCLQRLA